MEAEPRENKIHVLGAYTSEVTLVTSTALVSLNVVLHFICSSSLLVVYAKRDRSKTKQLYLINLSLAELLRNICYLVLHIFFFLVSSEAPEILYGAIFIFCTALDFTTISAMFLITVDRLLASLLNMRYNHVCTAFRVKILISSISCSSCLMISIWLAIQYASSGFFYIIDTRWKSVFFLEDSLLILFLLFSTTTYCIIFVVFVRSRRRSSSSQQSAFHMFTHSKFYIAILLITSFLVTTVIPRIGMLPFLTYKDKDVESVAIILVFLSDFVDGVIYILVYDPVRKILGTLLCRPTASQQQPQVE